MNDLKGKFVNIVLSVEEGRGFDSIKKPLYITANFNGRIMESDVMEPHTNIMFNTEMVWETEKKLLRKARGAYNRIRIECYTEDKKYVGFVLMCLRSAKILPSSRTDFMLEYKWNKLLNVPTEFKKGMPELQVSLTIRDYITNKVIPPALPSYEMVLETPDSSKVQTIPVKYTKNGFIQVGANSEKLEKFVFKITVRVASNLDLLLPETLVFSQVPKKYYLSFAIFGMNVKTRNITRDLHENINVNETVVINLLSNFKNLGMYFEEFPDVDVDFYNDDTKLGWTKINLANMGWDMDTTVFQNWCDGKLQVEEDNYFLNNNLPQSSPIRRRPALTTKTSIELRKEIEEGQGDKDDFFVSPRVRYSSCVEGELLVDNKLRRLNMDNKSLFLQNLKKIEEKCDPSIVSLTQADVNMQKPETNPLERYTKYCLNVVLDSLTWKKPLKQPSFNINFLHPKCSSVLSIKCEWEKNSLNKKIMLESAVCKLMFICNSTRIVQLLSMYPPKLQITDSKNTANTQEVSLDCSKVNHSKREHAQVVELPSPKNEALAEIHCCLYLETMSMNSDGKSHFELLPHILDDNIVFECLDDLEKWKEGEMAQCSSEIERKKKEELEVLQTEWIARKDRLENDLKTNISRCKKLSHELKKNAEIMMLDKVVEERKEQEEDFNWSLEIHKNTVKYSLLDHHEFIEKISELERDAAIMRDILSEQSLEMQEIKKSALTGEQTRNLLHDLKTLERKYEEAQKDKNYFKLEWEKAAKEVHNLKIENQKSIQDKINTEKEQLSQLSLDTFGNFDEIDEEDT